MNPPVQLLEEYSVGVSQTALCPYPVSGFGRSVGGLYIRTGVVPHEFAYYKLIVRLENWVLNVWNTYP